MEEAYASSSYFSAAKQAERAENAALIAKRGSLLS